MYDSNIHRRRSIRLKNYDYSANGAYFLTLCAFQRKCIFGKIMNDEMIVNELGVIICEEWVKSSNIRQEIILDEYAVMPNHFHGIVFMHNEKCQSKSISSFIAGFKSAVTKRANKNMINTPVWQRNYYEHIIRHEKSLEEIRKYVKYNVFTWTKDSLFSL